MTPEPTEASEPLAPASPGPRPLLERIGARARDRAPARFGVALAAAGAAIAVVGGAFVGGDQLAPDDFDGSPETLPGTLIMLLLVVGGFALLALATRDPLRAAGATAGAVAIPVLLFFLTFDVNDFPPFSVDAILLVSSLLWGLAYLVGPSTGRPFFLGAALVGAWMFLLEQVESVLTAPFLTFTPAPFVGGFRGFDQPDLTTLGILSLAFGYGYLVVAALLDGRGLRGLATPFVVAGLIVVNNGFGFLAEDLEPAGVGVLLVGTGLGLAVYFSGSGRRGTTWIGAASVATGVALIIGDVMEDSDFSSIGVTALVVGALVVAVAEMLSRAMNEPGEFDDILRVTSEPQGGSVEE